MNLLNIGCGSTFHPDWLNIDLVSSSPAVRAYDIRRGLPFPDASFDACYHSHLLEHLTQAEAHRLLQECWRVLRQGGILRLAVPDLEAIARNYLRTLERAEAGDPTAGPDYDWMMLELYDQAVRSYGGGEMGRYLVDPAIENKAFVKSRIGLEAERYWAPASRPTHQSVLERVKTKGLAHVIRRARIKTAQIAAQLIAGREARAAFDEGLFRRSGEIHRWMYDRFSLRRQLEQCGFSAVRVCRPTESAIPEFNRFQLDVINGRVRKPDSLFIEGQKA